MDTIKTFFAKHWHLLLAVVLLLLVVYLIYRAGKKSGTGNTTVVDDQGNIITATPDQQQQANNIATRIHDDINSGTLFGYNVLAQYGRDNEAYEAFAIMSDSLFAFTAQVYHTAFGSSIIADIRNETSLESGGTFTARTPKDLILEKANRLNIQ